MVLIPLLHPLKAAISGPHIPQTLTANGYNMPMRPAYPPTENDEQKTNLYQLERIQSRPPKIPPHIKALPAPHHEKLLHKMTVCSAIIVACTHRQ